VCQEFRNQNFDNLFHSFFSILAHRSRESDKNCSRSTVVIPKKFDNTHTDRKTDRQTAKHLYYKLCWLANSGAKKWIKMSAKRPKIALTYDITPPQITNSGLVAIITNASFHPYASPMTMPPTKIDVHCRKLPSLSPMPSLILFTSLHKHKVITNPTIPWNTIIRSSSTAGFNVPLNALGLIGHFGDDFMGQTTWPKVSWYGKSTRSRANPTRLSSLKSKAKECNNF